MNFKQKSLRLAVAANLTIFSVSSYALTGAILEEVVVTAQKREQSLQDVPVAVSAFSGDMIERQGIDRVDDLERISPSLSVYRGFKNTQSGLSIRGIGNNTVFSLQVEPAVLMVWDDVSLVQSAQAMSTMVDVERVEVLRGPQNTLFGKNASAGVINIVSRPPSEEFEGRIETTLTDDEEVSGGVSLSGPITENLRYRLTGFASDLEGNTENLSGGAELNDREATLVRGTLAWDASENLAVTLNASYGKAEESCCTMVPTFWEDDARLFGFVPIDEVYPGLQMEEENMSTFRDDGDLQDTEDFGASIKLDWQIGDYQITSITAYSDWENWAQTDLDFSAHHEPVLGPITMRLFDSSDRQSSFLSQEFRLVSPSRGEWDYLLGAYYSKIENEQRYERFADLAFLREDEFIQANTESYALFGQTNWHFTNATTLTFGLRLNHEKIDADVKDFAELTRVKGDDSDTAWIGKLSIQHELSEETMVYAGVSTGYKGQAFDTTSFDADKAENPVKPEESLSYEMGVKSMLFDNRLQLNATFFYTSYDDFQAQDLEAENGVAQFKLLNVGELRTRGVELESNLVVTENLLLGFSAAYMDAEVREWDDPPCYPLQTFEEGCNVKVGDDFAQESAEGNKLPATPEWKYTLNADYTRELGDMPFHFFANLNYSWQDKVSYDITGSPYAVQDSFGITNISFGIVESQSARYQATLFVNNVFDEFYSGWITDGFSERVFSSRVITQRPVRWERYAGIRFRYSW